MTKQLTTIFLLLLTITGINARPKKAAITPIGTQQWGRYELTLNGPQDGNPFEDITLTALFCLNGDSVRVTGFYDGNGIYKIRFMPTQTGEWEYITTSNSPQLDGKRGTFICTAPAAGNRGMVKASGTHNFAYSDGTTYYPVGTTAYAWIHMSEEVQQQTLSSLREAQFNKLRMCVFPKHYQRCRELPELYPYEVKGTNGDKPSFDFTRPNPLFYRHLEERIDQLAAMDIEADIILFHPYDKGFWGFDQMSMEQNAKYLQYLQARLSSFRNVWWSMANEYDYVKSRTTNDWLQLIKEVRRNDPYNHLLSIHGSTATYFDYTTEGITHTSIQDEGPVMEQGRACIVRNIYAMPVVFDEVCYEGNLQYRWGRLSGQEMLHRMWNGLTCGTYVTHGECYQYHEGDYDTIFWAKGGQWRGESWRRIPFMRKVLADLPNPMEMADVSRDDITATAGNGYYMVYFGKQMQDSWMFNLPVKNAAYDKAKEGQTFTVEIIDTWNMTITPVPGTFTLGKANDYRLYDKDRKVVRLPLAPYLLLRIKATEAPSDK